jgi:hypothetical protein
VLSVECRVSRRPATARVASAFSLAEILVVMALLSFIVLGLMAMFNQTQRAFRAGLMQTDMLESGRLATSLIGRELELVTPSYYWNISAQDYFAPNFFTEMQKLDGGRSNTFQALPSLSGEIWRTNIIQDVFFVTHENKTWTGIGYFARTNRPAGTNAGAVCTLYRFQMSRSDDQFTALPYQMFTNFNFARHHTNELPTVSRIMDGVVHLRFRPCDPEGWAIPDNPSWYTNAPSSLPAVVTNLMLTYTNWIPPAREFSRVIFHSNAVPAFVEMEIGLLEQQTLERYRSLPIPVAAQYEQSPRFRFFFLNSGSTAHTHLFRLRVAVRNLDSLTYQ